jgi:hypothetical protein
VFILESTEPAIGPGNHLPWILFSDLMRGHPGAKVRFTVDGGEPSTAIASEDSRFQRGSLIPELMPLKPYTVPVGPSVCAKPPPGLSRKKWSKRRAKIRARVADERDLRTSTPEIP